MGELAGGRDIHLLKRNVSYWKPKSISEEQNGTNDSKRYGTGVICSVWLKKFKRGKGIKKLGRK